jgi:O-acetyl-ADP-ribose deacetylase (regulator of RNase III)
MNKTSKTNNKRREYMIKIVEGNILDSNATIIFHQVNCLGVMGSGLAKQIKDKYPTVYKQYKEFCNKHKPENLLGQALFVRYDESNCICNLFGQLNCGADKIQTDYNALRKALLKSRILIDDLYSQYTTPSLAFPFLMSCGLGGGDWTIVYNMIEEIFEDYNVTIYKFEPELRKMKVLFTDVGSFIKPINLINKGE